MKVAAYQALLAVCHTPDVVERIREQVERCESERVDVLCCPEGIVGGLADYVPDPGRIAIRADDGELAPVLEPLSSDSVTTILGFTERGATGELYNSAVVYQRGAVHGVYRKHHPAINHSVYRAGTSAPVFTAGGLTFGIIICLDSTFDEPAATLVRSGARALFIPSNNGLPPKKGGPGLVDDARRCDSRLARAHGIHVVRADVTGAHGQLTSHGSSAITAPDGTVLASAPPGEASLLIASCSTAA